MIENFLTIAVIYSCICTHNILLALHNDTDNNDNNNNNNIYRSMGVAVTAVFRTNYMVHNSVTVVVSVEGMMTMEVMVETVLVEKGMMAVKVVVERVMAVEVVVMVVVVEATYICSFVQ